MVFSRLTLSVLLSGTLNKLMEMYPVIDRITDGDRNTGANDLKLRKSMDLKNSTLFMHGVGYRRASEHYVRYFDKSKFAGNDIISSRIKLGLKRSPI